MPNTHGTPDTLAEIQRMNYDLLPACIGGTSGLTTPGSGLTLANVSAQGYVPQNLFLKFVVQPPIAVPIGSTAGAHWLALTVDTHSAVAGWTRIPGSHFIEQANATQPTAPDGALLVAQITVSGANITAVAALPSPPLSRQNANAVAITGGSATGMGAVTSGSVTSGSVLIDWTGNPPHGLVVNDAPAGAHNGLVSNVSAGTNRLNLNILGTAPNYLTGSLGIANNAPSYALDVTGSARVTGNLGLNGSTPGQAGSHMSLAITAGVYGMVFYPPTTGTRIPLSFRNEGLTEVGSISMTASATAYNTSSDVRLKHAVSPLTDALAVLSALNPVRFLWNADDSAGVGFLAHELQQHVPDAVSGEPDALNDDGTIRPQGVDASKLVPYLTAALKELLTQVEALRARVATLEEALA